MTPTEILRRDLAKVELRAAALEHLESLLIDFEVGEIPDDGSYTYGDSHGHAERFMLSGGGPSTWAVFVQFGSNVMGYFEYSDWSGVTIVHIPNDLTDELRSMLRRDAKARNAR